MSRIADADLEILRAFLGSYRLTSDLGAQARALLLKRCHKHVLAALQVWVGFSRGVESGAGALNFVPVGKTSDSYSYIGEYFSDLVCVLSCAVHGLYKPANMQLRSAIENYVRGIAGLTSLEASETKIVYRLFELAAVQPPFQGASASDFAMLQQVYGEQCLHVHSATQAQRTGAHQVAAHMRQDTGQLRDVVVALERANRAVLSIFVRANKRLYFSSSPRVRDLLDEVLPKDVRIAALGGA